MLARVDAGGAFANVALHYALARARFSPEDAALATELVWGTLRYQARLDWTLAVRLRYALDELPPRIRAILRSAVYQLLFLRRVPAHAAVHEAVTLARRHGHAGTARLTNAVLRAVAGGGEQPLPDAQAEPAGHIAIEHAHPRWLVDRWIARYGAAETIALCSANNTAAPVTARVNTLRTTAADVARELNASGVTVEPTLLPEGVALHGAFAARHRLVESGLLTPQDVGAMLVTRVLDPQPGETVIDACAAPGGKTTHIAERMADRGRVVACDIHAGKLEALRRRTAVMGLHVVEVRAQDARHLGSAFPAAADRVLVDAPCTGLGVVRRRPDIKWRIQPGDLPALAALQRAVLEGAASAVRPGGVLVYSVCTTEPEEGSAVVDEFVRRHPEYAPDPAMLLPAGVTASAPGVVTLLPHRHNTDGFYIARLHRVG